jgi:hypothetical protein
VTESGQIPRMKMMWVQRRKEKVRVGPRIEGFRDEKLKVRTGTRIAGFRDVEANFVGRDPSVLHGGSFP